MLEMLNILIVTHSRVNITTSKENSTCGLEKLYAHHIQTELKRMKCEQQQRKISEMLEVFFSLILLSY